MKSLYICGLLALTFFQSRAQSPPFHLAAVYVDGVRADSSVSYLDPTCIDSTRMVKDGRKSILYIRMKPGHNLVAASTIARDSVGDPMLPAIYLINGRVILQPDSLLLDRGFIKQIQLIRTKDIPSVKDVPNPMALVLITFKMDPWSRRGTIRSRH